MKTYKHLWDQFISKENFDVAVKKAVKSKKNKKYTQKFLQNQDVLLERLRQDLIHDDFKTSKYHIFHVFEPKKREIYELPLYPDHIVHHALINVLGPIWKKRFITDSYACIPGRGVHSAIQKTMILVKKNKYVLQCDIRKFYPSINHEIMMNIISKKIRDRKILRLLYKIVFSLPGGKNLPIGNLTSQWMGNVYLTELDFYIKHVLKCRNYVRYSDDFCIFHNDKEFLVRLIEPLRQFLRENLDLEMSKSILKQSRGLNFIGYRLFGNFILLRRRVIRKIHKRIQKIVLTRTKNTHTKSSLASTRGIMSWANTYNLQKKVIKSIQGKKNRKMLRFIKKHFMTT